MIRFSTLTHIVFCAGLAACADTPNQSPEDLASSADLAETVAESITEPTTSNDETTVDSSETIPVDTAPEMCDVSTVKLLDFTAWQREAGYWVGEYTLLGADGNPSTSAGWPYGYDHYRGFIHLEVDGNSIRQRNVFVYPPQREEACTGEDGDVIGNGTCGTNGNEKVFSADQSASDCEGNLAGPYVAYGMEMSTATTLLGDDTVLYQVRMPDGSLMQNQLTSLPGNDTRVRTAQGFYMGAPTYASFYRERRVSEDEFFELLAQARNDFNILEDDHCGYDAGGQPTEKSCDEHFGIE